MKHEKSVGGGGGEERRKDGGGQTGRGLEVNGGQLAAGRLRELRHHAGQGPILSLQPLLDLPQGLNLLYLGEVLQWRGGGQRKKTNKKKQNTEDGRGGQRVAKKEGNKDIIGDKSRERINETGQFKLKQGGTRRRRRENRRERPLENERDSGN